MMHRALANPSEQQLEIGRANGEAFPAPVVDASRRFPQQETLPGMGEIDPARVRSRDRLEIERRIVTEQTEPEPRLAFRRPMTGTGVAAVLEQQRSDVALKIDLFEGRFAASVLSSPKWAESNDGRGAEEHKPAQKETSHGTDL